MSFRSDREALRQRVEDLEEDVATRDAELARLKDELDRAKQPEPPPEPEPLPKPRFAWFGPGKAETEPSGDRWVIPRTKPELVATVVLILWPALFIAALAPLIWRGERGAWIPALIFIPAPILMLLYSSGVVLDRRARTITTFRRLILRFERTFPVEGHMLVVERDLVMPKNGDSYWAGRIHLGDQFLVVRKEAEANALAQRMAEFVGADYRGTG
jgi:hypothetical protein